jgi:hypothetical protein
VVFFTCIVSLSSSIDWFGVPRMYHGTVVPGFVPMLLPR